MRLLNALSGIVVLAIIILISTGCERKVVYEDGDDGQLTANSCFTCHGDDGYLLAAKGEWLNSIHASGNFVDYTNRSGCPQCHDHQGFIEYLETGAVSPPYDQVSAIHCFTCHSPHDRGDLTLRIETAVTLMNGDTFDHGAGNLCANCHMSRRDVGTYVKADVKLSGHWGPHHGPQGDLLNGSNAYVFAGAGPYEDTDHGSKGNNEGCVRCHMGNPSSHVGYKIGGHSFNMVNEDDGEELEGVCSDEACHGDAADSFDYLNLQTDVAALVGSLRTLLFDAGILDADGETNSITVADIDIAGALWNYKMAEEDRSHGVHNPWYIVDMLEASIAYMESLLPAPVNYNEPALISAH